MRIATWMACTVLCALIISLRVRSYQWSDAHLGPLWLPTLLAGVLAVVPRTFTSLQFSLRTMLIVITLAAMLLGLLVWWSRGA